MILFWIPFSHKLDISAADHLRAELDTAHAQLYQLHERFENLLEMYGGCLETIEEMKEDNEDLRKLCKEQVGGEEDPKQKFNPYIIILYYANFRLLD